MKKLTFLFLCLIITGIGLVSAQTRVTGTIVSAEDGEPVIGASVVAKGFAGAGGVTDVNGTFAFNVPEGATTLVVSYIGMITQEVAISQNMRIVMEEDMQQLSEVVVVAYGQQRKEAITGAVASIKAETMERRPVSAATAALEGLALGVQVNNAYGEPGAEASVRIRGFNSINGTNEPLYVVNGVPMGGNVGDIHASDIESITVLKDASSAALYGNKAANGVVLITTKSGRLGEDNLTIQANLNFGVYQRGMKEYERLNAKQYMEAYWMGRRNALVTGSPTTYPNWSDANAAANNAVGNGVVYNIFNKDWDSLFDSNGKLSSGTEILSGYVDDLDWFKAVERTGNRTDYNLNARGGSSKATYYMSLGYLKEEGYTKSSGVERFTGNMKIDVTPNKWFKAGLTLNGSNSVSNFMSGSPTDNPISYINPFYYARNVAPIYPVYLHDPKTGDFILDEFERKIYDSGVNGELRRPQNNSRHIAWETELNKDRTYRTTLDGIGYVSFSFLDDFEFSVKGNMNNRNSQNKTYNNAILGDGAGSDGRMAQISYYWNNSLVQELLTWKRTFNDIHQVEVLLGHENYAYSRQYTYVYKTTQKFADLMELSNFSTFTNILGYTDTYKTEGYFARAGYNYNHKYFAEGSYRRDGSSRFYKDNRWGNFWSLGGSWILTREEFMKGIDAIDYMKLRMGYGEVGQDAGVGYYAWMGLYTSTVNGGDGAFYRSQNEARDINWEKSSSFSVALETSLFKRANLSVEFYNKRSIDLLFNVTMPSSMGAVSTGATRPTVWKNIGTLVNQGVELGLDGDIVKTKDFKWNIGANLNFLKNKIIKLPDEYKEDGYISGTKKYMEGHSVYKFWLYQFAGVDNSNGRSLYLLNDKDYYIPLEDYTGPGAQSEDETRTAMTAANYKVIDGEAYVFQTTYAKRDWSGTALPTVYGSFTTSLTYKDFQLNGLFTYSMGGKMIDYSYQSLMGMSATPSALHVDLLKAWTPEQEGTGIDPKGTPALNTSQSTDNNALSTRHQIGADYFAIKNLTLSYSVPRKSLSKIGLSGVIISATAENLVMFTKLQGMSPQQSWDGVNDNGFMPARILSMGLSVKF